MLLNKRCPHGGDIYNNDVILDCSVNTNPFGMPDEVREALIKSVDGCENYPDPYCSALRKRISEVENVPEDNIICSNGAAELIYSYAYSLPKDRTALIISPTFCEYRAALEAAGISAEYYVLSEENGFILTDDFLTEELHGYGAVFLCTPNNPTGITVSESLLYGIARTGVRVFADMCFLELTESPDMYDIPRFIGEYPNVTVLKAFTKSYAMAGVRLGYAMSSDAEFSELMSRKTQCWNVSVPAQAAGIAASGCKAFLNESVKKISAERERMTGNLRSCGIMVYPSEANYLLLYSDTDLYGSLLKRGILVRDCSDYTGLKKGYIRVSVGKKDENDRLLTAIKEVTG